MVIEKSKKYEKRMKKRRKGEKRNQGIENVVNDQIRQNKRT